MKKRTHDETNGDLQKRTEILKALVLDVSKITDVSVELVMPGENNLSGSGLTEGKFIK